MSFWQYPNDYSLYAGTVNLSALDSTGNVTAPIVTSSNVLCQNVYVQRAVTSDNFINSVTDFPDPVANVITLPSGSSWLLNDFIDLGVNRLVCDGPVTIFGSSSETCGLSGNVNAPLISSAYTLALQNIRLQATNIKCIEINGLGNTTAYDWHGVNFFNTANIGTIDEADNFIYDTGAFLNSGNIIIGGNIGTISIFQSLLNGRSEASPILKLADNLTVTRRIRVFFSSIISHTDSLGIQVGANVTIPDESFKLDQCNFSGPGTYLTGISATDSEAIFNLNTGIPNTASIGACYITTPVATTISDTTTWVPIQGTLTAGDDIARWTQSSPARLTCNAPIERKYYIICTASFTTGNTNQVEIGFFSSKANAMLPISIVRSTASGSGRAENQTLVATIDAIANEFIEVRCRNITGANDITFDFLTFLITQI